MEIDMQVRKATADEMLKLWGYEIFLPLLPQATSSMAIFLPEMLSFGLWNIPVSSLGNFMYFST
jgi:hypothetical protein